MSRTSAGGRALCRAAVVVSISFCGLLACEEMEGAGGGVPVGPPISVPGGVSAGPFNDPAVAATASGEFVVVYDSVAGLFARLFDAEGAPKGPDFLVNQASDARSPDVAVDADGNFVVVWRRSFGTDGAQVFARRFDTEGGALGDEFPVSERVESDVGLPFVEAPAVAMSPSGNFVVAWAQGVISTLQLPADASSCGFNTYVCAFAGGHTVRARRFLQGGTQAEPAQLVAASAATYVLVQINAPIGAGAGSEPRTIDVAMDADDGFVVVWARHETLIALSPGVRARRFSANGVPGLTRPVSVQQRGAPAPVVAMDGNGGYIVVYKPAPPLFGDIERLLLARIFPAGPLPGGAEIRIDAPAETQSFQAHSVAMDPAGNFVVAWSARVLADSRIDVYTQRFAAGGEARGTAFAVNAPGENGRMGTRGAAMDASGNFVLVWKTTSSDDILARRYLGP